MLDVAYVTKNLREAWIFIKIKNPPFWWVLLSLVTWLEFEPSSLRPVRVGYLLKFTSRVDDL